MTVEFGVMNGPFKTSPLVLYFNEDSARGTPAVRIARNEEQIALTLYKTRTSWGEEPKTANYKSYICSDKNVLCFFEPMT